jgi:hypothetical protein
LPRSVLTFLWIYRIHDITYSLVHKCHFIFLLAWEAIEMVFMLFFFACSCPNHIFFCMLIEIVVYIVIMWLQASAIWVVGTDQGETFWRNQICGLRGYQGHNIAIRALSSFHQSIIMLEKHYSLWLSLNQWIFWAPRLVLWFTVF